MITINSNEEAQALIYNGMLAVDDDLEIAFDGFEIEADIRCKNIYSKDYPRNIAAWDINTCGIIVDNINVCDINALNINAKGDINALNINARDIEYYAICCAYGNINCTSIQGLRENARHFCLDGEITIKEKEPSND